MRSLNGIFATTSGYYDEKAYDEFVKYLNYKGVDDMPNYSINKKPEVSLYPNKECQNKAYLPKIAKVIFNKPATIVFWEDGTKTIVKTAKGEKFTKYGGVTNAIAKKALGGSLCQINKLCEQYGEISKKKKSNLNVLIDSFALKK